MIDQGKRLLTLLGLNSDQPWRMTRMALMLVAVGARHAKALKWVSQHLKGTRDKGTMTRPDKSKGLECLPPQGPLQDSTPKCQLRLPPPPFLGNSSMTNYYQ